jgi:type I restriction enzyme R subunit
LNLKENLASGDTSALLNLVLDNVEFSFTKISEAEMPIADSLLNLIKSIQGSFGSNGDQSDPQYVKLLDEFRRILKSRNIEELTADEIKIVKIQLKNIQLEIQELNFKNDALTAQYFGDSKFMRLHKKLLKDFDSPQNLQKFLITLKNSIDEKISNNYAILDNKPYFERGLWRDIKILLKNPTAKQIKNFAALIAQEYFDERKNFND